MSNGGRGLPLLSGPAPEPHGPESDNCRKCGKEFNILFARSRKCNHCGYLYCYSCSDYQALMPRTSGSAGYDVMPVCGFCIEHLTITAAGKAQLKSLPLAKLKKYANAYGIRIANAVEKQDVIEAIASARHSNGCLAPQHEAFYRRHSVPEADQRPGLRNIFRSPAAPPPAPAPPPPRQSRPQPFARPDLAPDNPPPPPPPPHNHYAPQYGPPPPNPQTYPGSYHPQPTHQAPPAQPYHQWNQFPGHYAQTPYNYPTYNPHPPRPPPADTRPPPAPQQRTDPPPPPPPPRPQPQASSRPPPPAPPSLDELLDMTTEAVGKLSISGLKSVLFTNHVNAGQVLEKEDLVKKVLTLIDDERRERDRQRQAHELEELERLQREQESREEREREEREREDRERERERMVNQAREELAAERQRELSAEKAQSPGPASSPETEHAPPSSPKSSNRPPPPKMGPVERGGLCVVCQDDEANIAIVDCGHMAMCRACSELIMNSSRECPLCRTRIVTESRLLRIFKS